MFYYWFSWLAIIFICFFSTYQQKLKGFILFSLLFNIVFINFHLKISQITFTLPYLYCLIAFWLIILVKRTNYFNYYLLFCLIIMYVGFRSLFTASPIWLFVNEFFLITLIFVFLLFIFVRSNKERMTILVTACLTGEWLFAVNIQKLDWQMIVGRNDLFVSLYLGIFLLFILQRSLFKYNSA